MPVSVCVYGFREVCNYLWDQSDRGEATAILQSLKEADQKAGKKLSVEKVKSIDYKNKIVQLQKLFYSFMVCVVSQLPKPFFMAKPCFSATCCLKLN